MRILYLIHGHDQFSVGGAENAAFSLFRELQHYDKINAWILAAVHTSRGILHHGELRSVEGSDREYLIGTSCDWLRFSNPDIISIKRSLQRLLSHVRPDIIHIQHYIHFGIDIIPLLQNLSNAKIVVTLHEYLALCRHNGQMITTKQLKLCERATPLACSMCFPDQGASDFFLRLHYIKTILESCDALISPSKFLIKRYQDCGITNKKFVEIDNGLPSSLHAIPSNQINNSYSSKLNRFGFFGQLNIYKGVLVLLKAVNLLLQQGEKDFKVNIYGANLEAQPQEFQNDFNLAYQQLPEYVDLRGSYRQSDLQSLMQENDWIIIPSIWWENSPVVIQESFYYMRPIIGSNIGGIMEKIDGKGGITFNACSEASLSRLLKKCIGNISLHQALRSQIQPQTSAKECASKHINMYSELISFTP